MKKSKKTPKAAKSKRAEEPLWIEDSSGDLDEEELGEEVHYIEVIDALSPVLEPLQVDAQNRKIIWPDAKLLSIDESIERIHEGFPQLSPEQIENKLVSWLEMEYSPESFSEKQMDELDRLTERWIKDHYRRSGRQQP